MIANSMKYSWPVLLVAGLVAATGCASAQGQPTPLPESALAGHTFSSTDPQIPGGGPLELGFKDENISAYAGCNRMFGAATLAGNTLRVDKLASTKMACTGDRADVDDWVGALLTSGPSWQLDGNTLTLRGQHTTVTLQMTS